MASPLIYNVVLKTQPDSVLSEDLCASEYSCASCSQVRICRRSQGRYQEVFRLNCGGSTPFCDPRGFCSANFTHECANVGIFPCMQDGVFPDPLDCKAYHVCYNGTSHSFQCPSGTYFNGTHCGSTSCNTINCKGKSGIKVPYPLNASTYAFCLNDKPLFMDICPPDNKMHEELQQCLPVCSYTGEKIPYHSDSTKYYSCSRPSTFVIHYCPEGQRFDPSSRSCTRTSVSCVPSRTSDLTMAISVYH
ncbi:uncharacterized protein LOC128988551 [Macrosteles quadrilineatus]|uniref:uncharacterized protein LOC128988551 n=1 Tax=Macrosteles quadrilineatus TaxID=74068 RepID=UPI0023E28275|nr:uncharacterized protein LOC128988551 [Macrosteles quadrilineatus]